MGETGLAWSIVALDDPAQLRACVELQRLVWAFGDSDLVSAAMMAVALRHGGTVLGAVVEDQVVGFVFGLPAWWAGRRIEHSHMLAVAPDWRNRGIGRELKLAQGQRALEGGIELVTWTFDPLESKNAHLNLNRLGARVRHHYRDLYGVSTSSELHSGLGTDRFLAEWDVTGSPAASSQAQRRGVSVLRGVALPDGRLEPEELPMVDEDWVEVSVPPDIQSLKAIDLALAQRWRMATRAAFVHYLQAGYEVEGLVLDRSETVGLAASYLLRKGRHDED